MDHHRLRHRAYHGCRLTRRPQCVTTEEVVQIWAEYEALFSAVPNEEWKPTTLSADYSISNLGRVAKVAGGLIKPGLLKTQITNKGYEYCGLFDRNAGTKSHHGVHRLVAKAFIPNPENKPEVNHIDGNPRNNHVSNLEWCTSSENKLHACRVLGKRIGADHHYSRLTPDAVRQIRTLYPALSYGELGRRFGVCAHTARSAALRKTWIHVT